MALALGKVQVIDDAGRRATTRAALARLIDPSATPENASALLGSPSDAVFAQAFTDRVYLRVADLVGAAALPGDVADRLRALEHRRTHAVEVLDGLAAFAHARGHEILALKGAGLQSRYPEGYRRYWWDVDLAVDTEEALWEVLGLLESRGFSKPYPGVVAADPLTGALVMSVKNFRHMDDVDLPFAVEVNLNGIQTGWSSALRLDQVWAQAEAGHVPGLRRPSPLGSLLVLLAECAEREQIRLRDLVDWNVLRGAMTAQERADADARVRDCALDYVVRRFMREASRLGVRLDATAAPNTDGWTGDHYLLLRLAKHEAVVSASTLSSLGRWSVVASVARQALFELTSRTDAHRALASLEGAVPAQLLLEAGMFLYLIPLAVDTPPVPHRHWIDTPELSVLVTPAGCFLANLTGVVSRGRLDAAAALVRHHA